MSSTVATTGLWEVHIKGKIYSIKALNNHKARWAGARKYCLEPNTNMTTSQAYQYASCYRVNGRKSPHGVILAPHRVSSIILQQFWSNVDKTSGCWLWKGYINSVGYGFITINGKTTTVHRLAWEIANGLIPPGIHVCHTCDNPPCVRIDHLFLGTPLDNIMDSIEKGHRLLRRPL